MAPEQWLGQKQDERTDIYSLGVVFYEMVAGRPPFMSADFQILNNLVTTQPPPPLPQAGRCINRQLAKALAKNRKKRHQRAGRFAEGIEKCLNPKI